mgnify:CR=1 FL=1
MIYLKLFLSFIQIGLFSIGGGYAALPLIQNQVVDVHGWLTLSEFVDVISIAEMTPGPIAVNSATFVGIKIAGIVGAVVATAGCILPSCVIVLSLAFLYQKYKKMTLMQGVLSGLRPAVVALIASAGATILLLALFDSDSIALSDVDWMNVAIIAAGIVVLRVFDPNPIWVIGGAGAVGLFFYFQRTLEGAARIWLSVAGVLLVGACVFLGIQKIRKKTTEKSRNDIGQ